LRIELQKLVESLSSALIRDRGARLESARDAIRIKKISLFFIFAPRNFYFYHLKKKEEETVNPPPKKINKKPYDNFVLN